MRTYLGDCIAVIACVQIDVDVDVAGGHDGQIDVDVDVAGGHDGEAFVCLNVPTLGLSLYFND